MLIITRLFCQKLNFSPFPSVSKEKGWHQQKEYTHDFKKKKYIFVHVFSLLPPRQSLVLLSLERQKLCLVTSISLCWEGSTAQAALPLLYFPEGTFNDWWRKSKKQINTCDGVRSLCLVGCFLPTDSLHRIGLLCMVKLG